MATDAGAATAGRKHPIRGWVIAIAVVAVVGVAAWILGDLLARSYAEQYIRGKIIEVFDLPADTDMEVTVGPGSLLAQALTGRIDSVDVVATDVSVGGLSGDAVITATGIPLDGTQPLETLRVSLAVGQEQLQSLSGYLSGIDLSSVTLTGDSIAIESEFTFFGLTIPVGVELEPTVTDGQLGFQPRVVTINGAEVAVDELATGPLGGIAGSLLGTQLFCVSEYLPQAMTLTDARVESGALVIELSGDNAALGGSGFTTMGTCPESGNG